MPTELFDRLLRVDLTAETVTSEPLPPRWRREYIGGKGLGARILYDELDPGVDPLGEENALLVLVGPLSGLLPGESRFVIVTKSPLTGTFLDSYCGGTFADRFAGALGSHAGLLITGSAERTLVVEVTDGSASLAPAEGLEGSDIVDTCESFPDAAVACIGPAGENRVRYATIATDSGEHHAGRGGAGAVLGAKGLKAIVARGTRPAPLADLEMAYTEQFLDSDVGRWHESSETLETVDIANEVGVLATRGWQEGVFEGADDIGIDAVRTRSTAREHEDEPIEGGFRVDAGDDEFVPRGATAMSLGSGLGIDDFDAVATLGRACDRLGMDVISAGNVVAWAVRASEAGLIDRSLSFGDEAGALALIEEIAARRGVLGDTLADGVQAAGQAFGGEKLVPSVKALESPAYDPRGATGMALAYATSDRGACHRRALPVEIEAFSREKWTPDDRVAAVVRAQNVSSVLWSLIADDFTGTMLEDDLGAEWLAAVGLEFDVDELREGGERIWTLTRLFNVREGFDRSDDGLPAVFTEPLSGGPADGQAIDPAAFESLLEHYYAVRGWGSDGRPAVPLLERLGLADVVDGQTPVARTPAPLPDQTQ